MELDASITHYETRVMYRKKLINYLLIFEGYIKSVRPKYINILYSIMRATPATHGILDHERFISMNICNLIQ